MATLSEVAARAGVSVSLVSRVLNDAPDARATAETRDRIRAAAAELGYRANFAARALKSARTHVLGVVLPDLANSIYVDLLDSVEEAAGRLGYLTLLARAEALLRDPDALPRLVSEGRVDGVIVQASDAMPAATLAALTSGSTPVVFVNSIHPDGAGSVRLDDEAAGRLAAEHLLSLGHRDLAFAGGPPPSDSAARRERGFRAALDAASIRLPDPRVAREGYATEHGAAAVAALLDGPLSPPSAIAVANVNAGYGVLAELRRRGLRVPEDISVIAIHDARGADHSWPPLTTVAMPLGALGAAAVSDLVSGLESGEFRDRVVREPAPSVRVRASTAPPSAG